MWDKFIGGQIRRANRNLLIVNLVILFSCASALLVERKLIKGFFLGGVQTDAAALANVDPVLSRNLLEVNTKLVLPTGYRIVERSHGSETVKYEFLLMKAGNRMVIVKVEPGQTGPHFTGVLDPMEMDLSNALRRDIKSQQVRDALLPVMLNSTDYQGEVWVCLLLALPVGLLTIWNLKKWMQRAADPGESPIVKQLEHRGGVMACQQIDSEMAQSNGKVGRAILTRSWIMVPGTFGVRIMNIDDVVWVYKKVTRHRVNFVPVGKTYTAILCSSTGKSINVLDREQKVNDLLASVAAKAPWAIAGYTSEAQTLWLKNRDALVQSVNQRRSALMKKAAAAPAAVAPAPA